MQALMIIDMQNDFVDRQGKARVTQAEHTVTAIRQLLQYWRDQHWPIIHVVRSHSADGSDSERFRRHAPVCVEGSWGAQPFPLLEPIDNEKVIIKRRFSAFFETDLNQWLNEDKIDHIVVTGTQLPNCIRGTVADALYRDLRVTVVTDACSANSSVIAEANLFDMESMGAQLAHSNNLVDTESVAKRATSPMVQ
ncbi:cysteine hydrolase family protein [Ferrimonas lipolytica]|uniref:Cysteine hydrolase n=1 Tax=Ferrimonas lipolytica TaxID=2724191 RepID=A0A6H1UCT5_9GAMM|nr:isochorismatase family cysteine hydrolase [Ferrimonas lipolytica]QIZ76895.1 cysteine hydrolase [Ferrimonas lipolytica]